MFDSNRIFVISCPQDIDRRDLTEKRLKEQNLEFEWFNAVDGYETDPKVFEEANIMIKGEPGSSGCALSHKRLWEKIVNENIESCIIMEDDVVFHEEFQQLAPVFWNISDKTGLIFMGHCGLHGAHNTINVLEGLPFTTHAYYITQKIAKWFLENFGTCDEHIDIHMRNLYYRKTDEERGWKSYGWWDGRYKSKYNNKTKLGVIFNGIIMQDHDMRNSITRSITE